MLLVELGRPYAACTAFRRARAAEPFNLRARYNLADTLDEMGRVDDARVHWQTYFRGDPRNSRAIAQEHYLQVTDAHFANAAKDHPTVERRGTESGTVCG